MSVFFSEHFKRQLKRLRKKYPHVVDDLLKVVEKFDIEQATSIGRSIFKIRIPSRDMQKGKSGGLRTYVYLYVKKNLLVPLCMYAKAESESITDNELQYHFDETIVELIRLG